MSIHPFIHFHKLDVIRLNKGVDFFFYICYIVYTLRDFYIFKTESTQNDLIETLSMAFGNRPTISSIERYFKAFKKEKESELYEWTRKNIDEIKKQQINPSTGDYDLFDSILKE